MTNPKRNAPSPVPSIEGDVPQRAPQPVFALRDTPHHQDQGDVLEQARSRSRRAPAPPTSNAPPTGGRPCRARRRVVPGGVGGAGRGDRRNAPPTTDRRRRRSHDEERPCCGEHPRSLRATARGRKVTITPAAVVVAAKTRKTRRRGPRPRPAKKPVVLSAPPCLGVGTLRRPKIAAIPKRGAMAPSRKTVP
jgi:hypothetical protein